MPGCEKGAPEAMTGARGITQGDRALLNCPGHHESTEDGRFFTPYLKNLRFFHPDPRRHISGGAVAGDTSAFLAHESLGGEDHSTVGAPATFSECKKSGIGDLVGKRLHELGSRVHQRLLEVLSLRSTSTGRRAVADLFPLPTSECRLSALFPQLDASSLGWLQAICMSLNSLWGGDLFYEGEVNAVTVDCLTLLCRDVERFRGMDGVLESFSWPSFFSTRGVDYKGDEVKTAKYFEWKNIAPALPEEIGRVPLEQVCTLGAQHYVENFDSFIKDPSEWDIPKSPRVMVPDDQWGDVCTGLVQAGVCVFLPVEDIFDTGRGPLLNGLFGVSKDEWVDGIEVFRLIMNLVPLNSISHPLRGDVETLPSWALMNPYFLQPGENLLVSSEDVRCFFYTISVPPAWHKYLAFNKEVPDECLPESLKGREVYLCSPVLPMGFLTQCPLHNTCIGIWHCGVGPMGHLLSKSTLLKLRSGRTALSPPTILLGGSTLTTTISWRESRPLESGV